MPEEADMTDTPNDAENLDWDNDALGSMADYATADDAVEMEDED